MYQSIIVLVVPYRSTTLIVISLPLHQKCALCTNKICHLHFNFFKYYYRLPADILIFPDASCTHNVPPALQFLKLCVTLYLSTYLGTYLFLIIILYTLASALLLLQIKTLVICICSNRMTLLLIFAIFLIFPPRKMEVRCRLIIIF